MRLCACIFVIKSKCSLPNKQMQKISSNTFVLKANNVGPYLSFLRSPIDTGLMEILGNVEREF